MLMKSLLSDLKADSIRTKELIEINIKKQNALKSFLPIRHLDFTQQSNLNIFYDRWKPIAMWDAAYFEPTRTTINQLKSTGVLSSTEPELAASFASYDVTLERNEFWTDNYYSHVEETFRMIYEMMNAQITELIALIEADY